MIGIHNVQPAAEKDERKDEIVDEKRFNPDHVIHLEQKIISIVKVNIEKTKSTNFHWYPRDRGQEGQSCGLLTAFSKNCTLYLDGEKCQRRVSR